MVDRSTQLGPRRSTSQRVGGPGSSSAAGAQAELEELEEFVLRPRAKGGAVVSFVVPPGYWREPSAQSPAMVGTEFAFWQRLIVEYGLNLYCAACRQIALAIGGRAEALEEARAHTRRLLANRHGDGLRAWSSGPGGWLYGDGREVLRGSGYFFSALGPGRDLVDPLTGAAQLPAELGGRVLEWRFYDPFLGENSWAALLGPLQVAGLAGLGADSEELELARSLLPALTAMQSLCGGVYARPAPPGREQERLIANETNLTLYAGLRMLKALAGPTPEVERLIEGLEAYFRRHLVGECNGELVLHTCGSYRDGEFRPGVAADGSAARFAVDVHTWGLSILGVEEIDSRHGRGSCFELWRTVKRHAGYYPQGTGGPLRGVGYSSGPGGEPIHHVCSPEWTFGAVNMCRVLTDGYERRDATLAAALRRDERDLLEGVAALQVRDPGPPGRRAYPYVNDRCDTGFGWDALPLPSLCATAWAGLVKRRYNPFRLGGEYRPAARRRRPVPAESEPG